MTRKPNLQLRKIVLEETNDGRDVVRYLKSVIVDIEGAPQLYGLRAKDYARTHKIAAARILARIGLEEGKRYLRRTYVQTPFKRVHPEDEDGPKTDMAASTTQLYRLVKKETNDGADIIIRFVEIMKGYHPEYKPHLRMAAAKELIRQIEFDYEEDPSETVTASVASIPEPATSSESNSDPQPTNPVNPINPVNPDSDEITAHHQNHTNHSSDNRSDQTNPVHPTNPDSDEITANQPNHTNHSSDPYRAYAAKYCAPEEESIYQSIIRRASDSYNLDEAKMKAQDLIAEFDDFMAERDPNYQPIAVPGNLITKSLTDRMRDRENWLYDPADYYHLDQDYFYYCLCNDCDDCDELDDLFELMRELEEEYEDP